MPHKCVSCNGNIEGEFGKLKGTTLNVKNEKGVHELIYICSECQKIDGWIEKAMVKGV